MIHLTLPYPPSVNRYWRNVYGRVLISKQGRQYRKNVCWAVLNQVKKTQMLTGRLSVKILAHMPDKRIRDLDNILKAALDAMAHAKLYSDDGQIDRLQIVRGPIKALGELEIDIFDLTMKHTEAE